MYRLRLVLLISFLALFAGPLKAQVNDSFSDMDFSMNPSWTGDGGRFMVNPASQLQLNDSLARSSYLSVRRTTQADDSLRLVFSLRLQLDFSPSGSNYAKTWLMADTSDPSVCQEGIWLQWGESGSNDALRLFRRMNGVDSLLASGTTGRLAQSPDLFLKFTIDSLQSCSAETSIDGLVFQNEFQLTTPVSIHPWFILDFTYTASNATKFYFDDFRAGPPEPDTISPRLLLAELINDSLIRIEFSEIVADSLIQCILIPDSAQMAIQPDPARPNSYFLFMPQAISKNTGIHILIKDVGDLSGNILGDTLIFLFNFFFERVTHTDIVFCEVMCDPDGAPGLPDAEYIEITNRSPHYFRCKNWNLTDRSSQTVFPDDTLYPGQRYLILKISDRPLFPSLPDSALLLFSQLPSLNNEDDSLSITDSTGLLIDQFSYRPGSYQNPLKSNGGWSLERIDEAYICQADLNWKASENTSGGSPAQANSVSGIFIDQDTPYLQKVSYSNALPGFIIHFSEQMDFSGADSLSLVNLSPAKSIKNISIIAPQSIAVELNQALQAGEIIKLEGHKNLSDCSGNKLNKQLILYSGIAKPALKGDLVINEILFNPDHESSDYIELLNRSDKLIQTAGLQLGQADLNSGLVQETFKLPEHSPDLAPGDYLLLSDADPFNFTRYGTTDTRRIVSSELPSMPDDEGFIYLLDFQFSVLDSLHYQEDWHHPLLENREAVSLERIRPEGGNSADNWHSASARSGFGTPARANSQQVSGSQDESELSASPMLISPDNDGFEDYSEICFRPLNGGGVLSLLIYNEFGQEIGRLANAEIVGAENCYLWNGRSDSGELLPRGNYLLLADYYSATGERRRALIGLGLAYRRP